MKKLAAIVLLSSILFAESAHHNVEQINTNSQEISDSINQGISMSCNINIDFLTDMIPLYQNSLDIATLYLDESNNEALKDIAQQIIDLQSDEIEFFQKLIKELDKEKKDCDSATYKEVQEKKQIIINDIIKEIYNLKLTNNMDLDFTQIMISNSKNFIKNAEIILDYTNNDKIKEIAKNIIQTQNDTMDQIQKEMNNIKSK